MKIDRAELSHHSRTATADSTGARGSSAYAAWLVIALLVPAGLVAEISIATAAPVTSASHADVVPAPDSVPQDPESGDRQTGETARNDDPFIADDIRGAALVYASAVAPASNCRVSVS